jgi:hypothetical protein
LTVVRDPSQTATVDATFKLVATSGPLEGKSFEIDRPMAIGRQETDIVIDDQTVSRRHASVRPAGDTLEVEDLGSLNGTKVDDAPVTSPTQVGAGAQIEIGDTVFRVDPVRDPNATVIRQVDVTRASGGRPAVEERPEVGPTGTRIPKVESPSAEPMPQPMPQQDTPAPEMQPVSAAEPSVEPEPELPARRIAKAYAYSGVRLVLGYGADFYAIWDRADLEHPVSVYPKSQDGWAEAWTAFIAQEPMAAPVP